MFTSDASKISAPLVQAIEDAILLGNIKEIDGVLDLVRDDDEFPAEIRYALESLLYFRLHYGKGGALAPVDEGERRKMYQMETSWGRELIEMIGHYPELADTKYA